MPLFSPAQAKSAAEQRFTFEAQRARNLSALTDELREEQAETERMFQENMDRQKKEHEEWFVAMTTQKNNLKVDVEDLEERRRRALMPPLIKAEDIHSTEEALWARKLELDAREFDVEEESRVLMRRLDEVSSREQDVDARSKRLKRMESGAQLQHNQVSQSAKQLNLQILDFQKRSSDKEAEFAYQQSELDAKENLSRENERLIEEREREIEAGKRLLADQRLLLEKGFAELNRLKEKYGNRSISA